MPICIDAEPEVAYSYLQTSVFDYFRERGLAPSGGLSRAIDACIDFRWIVDRKAAVERVVEGYEVDSGYTR